MLSAHVQLPSRLLLKWLTTERLLTYSEAAFIPTIHALTLINYSSQSETHTNLSIYTVDCQLKIVIQMENKHIVTGIG